MSSMSSVAGLSKYIKTLPKVKISLFSMIFISFITGAIIFLLRPINTYSQLENLFYGGSFGFFVFGIGSIVSGATDQQWVYLLKGINLKRKHSMFLSLTSMVILCVISVLGLIAGIILKMDLFVNSILFGCVLIFAWNFLVLWGTSHIGPFKSFIISLVQPLLIISMLIVVTFLGNLEIVFQLGIFGTILKVIIACLVFLVAIYSFMKVVENPMKNNLGFGALDLLSFFIAHMNEGSSYLENLFDTSGEEIDTIVGTLSFKKMNGDIKALFISPSVHPGPIGDIGGANMPTLLANEYDYFTMVAHGPSTHDFNPVSVNEIYKIKDAVNESLEKMNYSSKCSKFVRYSEKQANIGVQFFNDGILMLSTFAPSGSDDIEFSIGLSMMIESQKTCKIENSIVVDCHNSFNAEKGGVLPGNPEVFQLLDAIKEMENINQDNKLSVGTSSNLMSDLDKTHGVGESGLKVMVIQAGDQKTAIALFDSNNMELGFRETIFEALKDLPIDELEVLTTDTHSVNTLSKGYNPIGTSEKEKIIDYLSQTILEAIDDLEPVEAGTNVSRIKNLKTFGPNNSTELISTISSIVAVSKIMAPLIFIVAIIFVFIWIYLL